MSALGERIVKLSDAFYDRLRDRSAFAAAKAEPSAIGFAALRGHKYCLLVEVRPAGAPAGGEPR